VLYEKILVGFDGSSTAQAAVDRAVEVAAATGARLTILQVSSSPKAQEILDAEAARHAASGTDIDTLVRDGDPAGVLTEVAESGYDLLIVGNKGMKGAARFFLGSVPNKISHHARCSLMIVRTT
jgi:nucleotide-binding universal stress UspA family protein